MFFSGSIYCDCREDNYCSFCKYWIGESPSVDYKSGSTKLRKCEGLCSKRDGNVKSDGICNRFARKLEYM